MSVKVRPQQMTTKNDLLNALGGNFRWQFPICCLRALGNQPMIKRGQAI
jgi:hypothetical protein